MKEFFIISNLYRTMNNILKNKLKQHNIPLNETQLNILFLMYGKDEDLNAQELLQMGNFALSSLLFNLNNLQNTHLLASKDTITQFNLKNDILLSENGRLLLAKVDKLCATIYKTPTNNNELLLAYEEEFNKAINKTTHK